MCTLYFFFHFFKDRIQDNKTFTVNSRHYNQYEPPIFKLDSGHIQNFSYLQIFNLNTTLSISLHTKEEKNTIQLGKIQYFI